MLSWGNRGTLLFLRIAPRPTRTRRCEPCPRSPASTHFPCSSSVSAGHKPGRREGGSEERGAEPPEHRPWRGREANAVLMALRDRGSAGCSCLRWERWWAAGTRGRGETGWYLLSLVPGEGHVELGEHSLLLEAGQLLSVQVILVLTAAAIVKHCLAHLFACRVTQPPSALSPPRLPLS